MDYHLLGLGSASSLISAFRVADWGASVYVDCLYDPQGEKKQYQLAFRGCTNLALEMMPDANLEEQFAEMIGISLGHPKARRPAVLTTDLFELQIAYERFQCIKSWQLNGSAPAQAALEISPQPVEVSELH